MPESVITTSGIPWINRNAHATGVSSGRAAVSLATASSERLASLPPRTGSMTHTGRFHFLSSSTLPLASWNSQSSQLS